MAQKSSASGPSKLPDNIYILLLDSLFQERRTFVIRVLITSGAMALTFWEAGEPLLAFTSTLFVAVAIARLLFMYAYQRLAPQLRMRAQARKWEGSTATSRERASRSC